MSSTFKELVRERHLGEWKELFAQKVVKSEIQDDNNLREAYRAFCERNPALDGLWDFVKEHAEDVKEKFSYLHTAINNRQLVTAMTLVAKAHHNSSSKYQLCEVPAG